MLSSTFLPARLFILALLLVPFASSLAQPLGAHVDYPAGTVPLDVAVADFNLDGKPDVALLSQRDTVSVFLGSGSGTFGARTPFPGTHTLSPETYGGIAAGDVNNDGKADVVVAMSLSRYVRLGNGNGTFGSPIQYPTTGLAVFAGNLALADFDLDGKLDILAVANVPGDWVVHRGNGDGTFGAFGTGGSGSDYMGGGLTIGDFNRDGKLDIALGNRPGSPGPSSPGEIRVHLGNGDGTFGAALVSTVLGETDAWAIGAGDFNRDGIPDIAVGSQASLHVTIMAGVGNGTFTHAYLPVAELSSLSDLAVGDVTNDGQLDAVTTHYTADQISVFEGDGGGGLPHRVDIVTGSLPKGLAIADLNSDIDRDVAVAANSGALSIHLNTGLSQVNMEQSYFVPQAGSVAAPSVGADAIKFFRMCPNNDGGSSLPLNARIKIVLRNSHGSPVSGIASGDVCLLFNGGTPVQGFTGVGADSIIANSTWNQSPLCPDVRCVPADASTDALGTTFITFTGSTPGSPGVGTRDPNRKWGHYDNSLPVFANGIRLDGRLLESDPNGTYTLRIKNYDVSGGLTEAQNQGERINTSDFNTITACIGNPTHPLSFWCDYDWNGAVNSSDFSIFSAHNNHNCGAPLP